MQPTKPSNTRKKIGLWLVISPTALIVFAVLLSIIVNVIFNPTFQLTADGEPPAATPLAFTITNIVLFIVGITGALAWLPALIVGIVLLATAHSVQTKQR